MVRVGKYLGKNQNYALLCAVQLSRMSDMGKRAFNMYADDEFYERVRKVAEDRQMTMSRLMVSLVTDGLDEIEELAAAAANPIFMEAMKGMFGNPQMMGAMMEIMGKGNDSESQMKMFDKGMNAFADVVTEKKKGGKKK